ncbi:hypothetical protein THF1C08_20070 [Vibrio jasicida]|uniref:Uncharacterized protein n=1 Tax=Vibrio jasicida TaxID=766224 RepID=A0AAU9QL12_9VIBR|nr:hypothetical protein THF1C08_20070 [Vibrio jasicida]CAH1584379.1 hypothetical protein THF1A12_20070 [Vibrio jasicida]
MILTIFEQNISKKHDIVRPNNMLSKNHIESFRFGCFIKKSATWLQSLALPRFKA